MPYIDRDVFEALGGTAAGKRVFDKLASEMAPRNAQNLPDWLIGFHAFRSVPEAKRYLSAIADSLYSGRPNVASTTLQGRTVREHFKRRPIAIVTEGDS